MNEILRFLRSLRMTLARSLPFRAKREIPITLLISVPSLKHFSSKQNLRKTNKKLTEHESAASFAENIVVCYEDERLAKRMRWYQA